MIGPNFLDWLNNLRIVLKWERLANVIVNPLPQSPAVDAPKRVQREDQKCLVDSVRVGLIIHTSTSMSPKFQKQYKNVNAYSIVHHQREHYNEQARTEKFKVSELFFGSKMEEGTSPVPHALKMYEHIERLNQLSYWMDFELSIDLIMAKLPDSFAQFVLDYRMDYIVSTIPELVNVLKIAEGKVAKRKAKETISQGVCFYYGKDFH